ncbi:MAG: lipoate--protein ligase family protein [Chitinispirillales bacterium]|nr:lipoate--protein ligase family protein [Chitinispirillales bacterium]
MAADLYLLNHCINYNHVTIRLYSWAQPSITIGYMQAPDNELDLNKLRAASVGWIKRPTGGRAVLHDGDITYSCVFPKTIRDMGSGITETYRLISQCLISGLEKASIKCTAHDSSVSTVGISRSVKLPCFLAPSRDEIMVDGKKLIGSAQKRTATAALQHGSIPITGAFRGLPEYLRIDKMEKEKQAESLMSKCCCIDELVTGATFESLAECLIEGFSAVLPFKGELIPWSSEEEKCINDYREGNGLT